MPWSRRKEEEESEYVPEENESSSDEGEEELVSEGEQENSTDKPVRKPRKRAEKSVRKTSRRKALSLIPVPESAYHVPRKSARSEIHEQRDKLHSLPPLSTWSDCDVYPECMQKVVSATENDAIRDILENDVWGLKMLDAYVDYFEVQQMQLVRVKSSLLTESSKLEEQTVLEKAQGQLKEKGLTNESLNDMLTDIQRSCVEAARRRKDSSSFKVKISGLGPKLEKALNSKELKRQTTFDKLLAAHDLDTSGMDRWPVSGDKLWSTDEDRRLRGGMFIFGRDLPRVAEYANIGRIKPAKKGAGPAQIKSKFQKVLLMLRKFALPLPPAVEATGKEYTYKGVQPLDVNDNFWTTFWPGIHIKLPMRDVPFGRRLWEVPNEPIFVNLM